MTSLWRAPVWGIPLFVATSFRRVTAARCSATTSVRVGLRSIGIGRSTVSKPRKVTAMSTIVPRKPSSTYDSVNSWNRFGDYRFSLWGSRWTIEWAVPDELCNPVPPCTPSLLFCPRDWFARRSSHQADCQQQIPYSEKSINHSDN